MRLFKFKSLQKLDHVLDILLHERLYCSPYLELNDPFEGLVVRETMARVLPTIGFFGPQVAQRMLAQMVRDGWPTELARTGEAVERVDAKSLVCSLSTDSKDVRLWSFYADSHRGIAIEVDFTGHEQDAREVHYEPGLWTPTSTQSAEEILSHKTRHWKFESERRIFSNERYYPVSGRIVGIHAGIRADHDVVGLLDSACGSRYPIRWRKLDEANVEIVEDPSYMFIPELRPVNGK